MPNRILLIFITLLLGIGSASAQKYPERSLVRKGNRDFAKERYDRSIERYTQALEAAPENFEAAYNLGGALYRTEKYEEAAKMLERIAADSTRTDQERAEAFYNLGNAQFKQEKYPEALESYKNSLRMNPADQEAKYNYAYTKRLLQKQQNEDQNKDQNKDQQNSGGQDQNQDKNKDNNSDKDRQQDKGGEQQDQQDRQNGQNDPDKNGQIPTSRTATTGSPANPAKTASPRKNRNGCWMRSRPRRTRPRRNSRRKPGSWYAAIKTGNESILKRLCNSPLHTFCGCSRSFRSWWSITSGGPVRASIQVSTIDGVAEAPRTVRYYLRHLPFALRCAAVALLIVALARPQSVDEGSTSNTEGIDIVLAIDISTSMLAQDLQPDRIQAAKQVAGNFITDRPGDRIGLVAFAGEAFTQSPLTTDQGTLQTLLGRLRSGVVEDGTAIGNGLATAINRLRESNAKSKVIILLTDGENNRGEIAPLTAAEIARDQGIRVYTIGVGTRGTAPYPTVDFFGNPTVVQAKVQIDEKILGEIADLTGGRYFRATDNAKLQSIYDEINQLEKSKVEISQYTTYTEEYLRWAAAALALLLVEFLLRTLWLKSLP